MSAAWADEQGATRAPAKTNVLTEIVRGRGKYLAGAVMIAFVEHEHLGLVLQPAECGRMDHAVAIPAERAPRLARRLGKQPPAAAIGIAGKRRAGGSHSDGHGVLVLIQLIPLAYALNYAGRGIPNELGMTPPTIGDQK